MKWFLPIRVAEQQPQSGNVGVGFNNRRMELVDEAEYQNLFEKERQELVRDCSPSDNPDTRFFHLLTGLGELKNFVNGRQGNAKWKTTMPEGDISHTEVHMSD
jgi:hypothetical protein